MYPDFNYYWEKGNAVFEKIHSEFYEMQSKNYIQGLMADGSQHPEPSIMPSVLMYLDSQKERYNEILQNYSGEGYTTDWGVRMTSKYDEHYNPRAYHSGAVWPLYTGWVALAEYKNHRPLQGFSHVINNLNIYRDFALGYTEEVLNGDKYLPSGVCPHQCWSETMVLQPIIEGMLGIRPDMNQYGLLPNFPVTWDHISIENIRTGKYWFDMDMIREYKLTKYRFYSNGLDLYMHFWPQLVTSGIIDSITLNGSSIEYLEQAEDHYKVLGINFPFLSDTAEVIIYHSGGISLIPPAQKAVPGKPSTGIRIIDTNWENNTYTVEVEGAPAQSYQLEWINNFGVPKWIEGAEEWLQHGNRLSAKINFFALDRRYTPATVKVIF